MIKMLYRMFHDYYNKHRQLIPYIFFGVCTTLVNTVAYSLCAHLLAMPVIPSTILAWIFAVLFAFVTNRQWVFRSQAKTQIEILRECISFFSCRLATGGLDWLCMYFFVEILHWNDIAVKIAVNFLVIILNYFASKVVVFKDKKHKG